MTLAVKGMLFLLYRVLLNRREINGAFVLEVAQLVFNLSYKTCEEEGVLHAANKR
jgi:hypothetical protein